MKRTLLFIFCVAAIAAILCFQVFKTPKHAMGFSGGVSDLTSSCATQSSCHTSTAAKPTVTISGPDTLALGETATYTVTITGGPAGDTGGLDLACTIGGVLCAGENAVNVKPMNEITHSTKSRTFKFELCVFPSYPSCWAPGSTTTTIIPPTEITLYGVGLAADNSGSPDGDTFNTVSKTIQITSTPTTTPTTPPTTTPTLTANISVMPHNIVAERGGRLLVTIFGSQEFNVSAIDVETVQLAGTLPLLSRSRQRDVNADGVIDMILYFNVRDLNLKFGDTELCLVGKTICGKSFKGCTNIQVVGRRR